MLFRVHWGHGEMYLAWGIAHQLLMTLKIILDFLQVIAFGFIFLPQSEMWTKDLGNKSAALSISVLVTTEGEACLSKLAMLCDLCWLILSHCPWSTRNLEKYIVLHGHKPPSSGHDVWFSVVFSTARALVKMLNNSLSASLCAVQMFWPYF